MSSPVKCVGLFNLGNTCYANSVLQVLAHLPEVTSLNIVNLPNKNLTEQELVLGNNLVRVLNSLRDGLCERNDLINLYVSFARVYPLFRGGQQDPHEYLNLVLSILHDNTSVIKEMAIIQINNSLSNVDKLELKSLYNLRVDGSSCSNVNLTHDENKKATYQSCIFDHFTGQVITKTFCKNVNCGYVSNRFEVFRVLDLEMHKDNLCSSLKAFTKSHELEDKYECDKCHIRTNATRKLTFWRTPDVFSIKLGRFKPNEQLQYVKDNRAFSCPDTLDMTELMEVRRLDSCVYELVSVVNHIGAHNMGHCYSYIKFNNEWYCIDDDKVVSITQNIPYEQSSSSYMLFYRRINS